ncbi:MAG TPA: hypothetical protein VK469_17410, partial [Candidatus Kapabacteria bacterium]|nr:hypothetical protein [Candidatus Kapabacteria bacterium]
VSDVLDFLYRDNNSFVILLAGRRNVRDFNFALAKLKSRTLFIVFLDILELLGFRYLRYFQNFRDPLDIRDLLDIRYLLDLRDIRDILDLRDLQYIRDLRDIRYIRDLRDLLDLRYLLDQFLKNYKAIIEKNRKDIIDRADKAIEKLHGMPDKELLEYFPGTKNDDLKEFRKMGKQ